MKSRRNIKKTKRHSRHRNRKMTRRVKTKRGGMLRPAARAAAAAVSSPIVAARTSIYHHVLPLFTQFNTKFGKVLTPEQKAVVLNGERYYRSVADFPVDGPLKASITKLIDEFSSTEQNAQKALDIYNKILQALEEAETRQKENINPTPGRARDTFSSPLSTSLDRIAPMSLRNEPLGYSPSSVNRTDLTTPQKVSGYEKDPRSVFTPSTIRSLAPTLDNPEGGQTVKNLLFDDDPSPDTTPLSSPVKSTPGRLSSKSAPRSPFSPSRPPFRIG